jgi:hypothetical protein
MSAVNEWDGWPPYEQWTDADHERSLIGWLDRRVNMTSSSGSIRSFVRTFERLWAEQFGADTPIPQDVRDRVNARLAQIREAL